MTVYEMEGFLCGKCLPGDMKVNESNAQYLVRKLSELQSQNADMAVQLANAESKCSELATELSAVDKIHNEAVFITDDHYEQCPPEVQRMIRSLAVLRIPAYDAFLAEVRAQGVEMFAIEWGGHDSPYGQDAYNFASKIRQGAAK
ncbi:hypothetical protein R2522_003542 [Citrobacter freundii]